MLSLQVVKELDDLARKFQLGVSIKVRQDEGMIDIEGASGLGDPENLTILSNYEMHYGYNDKDEFAILESDKETMEEEQKILDEANLDEAYDNAREKIENGGKLREPKTITIGQVDDPEFSILKGHVKENEFATAFKNEGWGKSDALDLKHEYWIENTSGLWGRSKKEDKLSIPVTVLIW